MERLPDQEVIINKLTEKTEKATNPAEKYNRLIATRGDDYLLVYNYTGRPMQVDLTRITGTKKNAWWYSPVTGEYTYIGEVENKVTEFYPTGVGIGKDIVLVVTDAASNYKLGVTTGTLQNKDYEE